MGKLYTGSETTRIPFKYIPISTEYQQQFRYLQASTFIPLICTHYRPLSIVNRKNGKRLTTENTKLDNKEHREKNILLFGDCLLFIDQ